MGSAQPTGSPSPGSSCLHATAPAYLEVRLADLVARIERVPDRDEVPVVCEEQLVVEHYSR